MSLTTNNPSGSSRGKWDAYRVYLIHAAVTALFFDIAFALNLVYQAEVIGLDPLQLVLVGTTLEVAVLLFEVPTGIVADLYSRRLSIIIGFALVGLGILIEGLFPTFAAVLLAQVVWGIGITFTSGASQAWITDEVGEARAAQAFVRSGQISNVVGMVGLWISIALASVALNLPLIVAGIGFLLFTLFLILVMPEAGFKPNRVEGRSSLQSMTHTLRESARLVRLKPVLLTMLALSLVYGAYSESYDRLWRKHLMDNFSLPGIGELDPLVWFGIIGMVGAVFTLALQEFARRRVNMNQHRATVRALMWIYGMVALAVVALSLTTEFPLALAALWLIGALRATGGPIYDAWLNQNAEPELRATMFSVIGQSNALGQIAGGPLLGWIGARSTVRVSLLIGGVIMAASLPLLNRSLRRDAVVIEDPPLPVTSA